jgi:hypothetical protein
VLSASTAFLQSSVWRKEGLPASIHAIVRCSSYSAETVKVVLVVLQLAISEVFACEDQVSKLVAARWRLEIVALHAVEVVIQDAGVAVKVKEDKGVGERLGKTFHTTFHSIYRLCIVIDDYCLCC